MNHINLSLREQLDQATMINQKLSQEIHKVNNDWVRLREQLENREREWRDEEIVSRFVFRLKIENRMGFEIICVCEKSLNDYFGQEHQKMVCLWRTVVSYKRSYNEMKQSTERDLNRVKAELNKATLTMQNACLNFASAQKSNETQAQVSCHESFFFVVTFVCSLRCLSPSGVFILEWG